MPDTWLTSRFLCLCIESDMSQPTSCPSSPMMSPFPALSMFPPQLLEELLDVLQGLLHCGEAPAAARLTFAAFPSSPPLLSTHVCPLSFPPPTLSSSRRRCRRRRRKHSLHCGLPEEVVTKQPKSHCREFDIQSMGATIDRLAVFYSPIKYSPLLPDGDKQARLTRWKQQGPQTQVFALMPHKGHLWVVRVF